MSTCPLPFSTSRRRQTGSVAVQAVIALSLIVIALGSIQIGYLFFAKREYQKVADLAALAGAQQLTPQGDTAAQRCARAVAAAIDNARANAPEITLAPPVCGRWDPSHAEPRHFRAGATDYNALMVRVEQDAPAVLPFFSGSRTVATEAVASLDAPTAAFSVGSRLLRLEDGTLLPSLLSAVGLNLGTTDLLSYRGLANATITPAGLLKALGVPVEGDVDVGTLSGVAQVANLTLGGLLDASIDALVQQGSAADVQLGLLRSLRAGLTLQALQARVPLFGAEGSPGILVGLDTTGRAALDTGVDLLSLVTAGVSVANGANLVDIGNLGVLNVVQAKASIVEPPQIGIGGVGTIARSAQVRVYLRVNTGATPLVGPVLDLFGTGIDLPVIIELAQSTGELSRISCEAPRRNATIDVSSSQVNVCLGRFHDMTSVKDGDPAHFFSQANRCAPDTGGVFPDTLDGVRRHQILNVVGVLPLTSRVGLPVLASQAPMPATLQEPISPDDGRSRATLTGPGLNLAQSVSNIADAVTVGILGDLLGQGVSLSPAQRGSLATSLVGTGNNGAGNSISKVSNDLRWSDSAMAALGDRVATGGLTGVLGGTLQLVGNLLGTVLLDPLADLTCTLAIVPSAIRNCRISYIQNTTLNNSSNALHGVTSMVVIILQPVLNLLSQALNTLLGNVLGVSLGQTDVSLISVGCGRARLVY